MFEGPFAEQNSREVELKEFVEPALMGQVLHFLYFRNGEILTCLMRNYGLCCLSRISLDEIPIPNSSISLSQVHECWVTQYHFDLFTVS